MQKAVIIFGAVLVLQYSVTEANEFSTVKVNGWAKHCDAACQSNLTVYSKDGEELNEPKDLRNVAIIGKKEINDFEMVNVAQGLWVENDVVNIDYCEKKQAVAARTTAKRGTTSAMGSGEGC